MADLLSAGLASEGIEEVEIDLELATGTDLSASSQHTPELIKAFEEYYWELEEIFLSPTTVIKMWYEFLNTKNNL